MQPALYVVVASRKQRSPQAGERIDATDAEGFASATLGVVGQSQLCFGREGIVIHRRCSPHYQMIVKDFAELPFGQIRRGA